MLIEIFTLSFIKIYICIGTNIIVLYTIYFHQKEQHLINWSYERKVNRGVEIRETNVWAETKTRAVQVHKLHYI